MYDLAGNTTLTTAASYSIDNTAPTISGTADLRRDELLGNYVGVKQELLRLRKRDRRERHQRDQRRHRQRQQYHQRRQCGGADDLLERLHVNGTTYAYKSAQQTANASVTGTPSWSVTATDGHLNPATSSRP